MMIAFTILVVLAFQCLSLPSFSSTTITVPSQNNIRPLTLQFLLTSNQISKIELSMGHLTYRLPNSPFPKGIVARIFSQKQLPSSVLTQIASAFRVSEKQVFRIWNANQKMTIIADPNDKLCIEQLEGLSKLLIPCRNWMDGGLAHLLPLDKLLTGYLGIKLTYQTNSTVFKIIKEVDSKQSTEEVERFIRLTFCGKIEVQPFDPQQERNFLIAQSIEVEPVILSKWYYPSKTIAFIIKQRKSDLFLLKKLSIFVRLPSGFNLDSIKAFPETVFTSLIEQEKDQASLININIDLPIQQQELAIRLSFTAGMPIFQKFQSISGGGEELMNVVRVQIENEWMELGTKPLVQSLLQPDFSISFKIITVCSAAILLVWLALWRNHQLIPQSSLLEDE